jgi:hypothetical protein
MRAQSSALLHDISSSSSSSSSSSLSFRPSLLMEVVSSSLSDVASLLKDQSAKSLDVAAAVGQQEEVQHQAKEEKVEGRFFLRDKLCALGLASVSGTVNESHVL